MAQVLSAGPSPPAPADGAIAAPWSAPLLKDVLTVESLGEDLDVAALGVALACLALLDKHTVPGWLPALLDEQCCPLYGPISFCFEEDHCAVPIGVVRLNARCHSPSSPAHDLPTCSLVLHPTIRLRTCTPQMHQYVLLLVERLRMTVGELAMAYACAAPDHGAGELDPANAAGRVRHCVQDVAGRRAQPVAGRPPHPLPAPFLALHLTPSRRPAPAVCPETRHSHAEARYLTPGSSKTH